MVASTPVAPDPITQLVNQITAMQHQLDELGRRTVIDPNNPVCRITMTASASLAASADTYAQTGWAPGEDPDDLFTVSRGGSLYSSIDIPVSGRYLVYVRGIFTSPASAATMTAFVTQNGVGVPYSIVRGNTNSTTAGGDGTIVEASRPVLLNTGDLLYWGYWSSQACTLTANLNDVPSEVSITYLGPR